MVNYQLSISTDSGNNKINLMNKISGQNYNHEKIIFLAEEKFLALNSYITFTV